MADLLFDDQVPELPPQDEDPAAEFLAREQSELAALGDDEFVGGVSGGEAPQDTGFDQQDQFQSDSLVDDFGGPPVDDFSHSGAPASGDADFFGSDPPQQTSGYDFEDSAPTASDEADFFTSQPQEPTGLGDFDDAPAQNGPDSYSAIGAVDRERQEPEKLKQWRIEQQELLEKKDSEEQEKISDWQAAAKQELQDWYKHQNEQVEKTKVSNREAEAEFVKDRDASTPGQDWERIARLCEFNPKNSKNTKDVSRMRSILLQLKQTPLVR